MNTPVKYLVGENFMAIAMPCPMGELLALYNRAGALGYTAIGYGLGRTVWPAEPDAQVIATPATIRAMEAKIEALAGTEGCLAWYRKPHLHGASSLAMYSAFTGDRSGRSSHPHDPADFGRCRKLLQHEPEWAPRMVEVMGPISPVWRALAEAWPELDAMYAAEDKGMYTRMREIIEGVKP